MSEVTISSTGSDHHMKLADALETADVVNVDSEALLELAQRAAKRLGVSPQINLIEVREST